MRAGIGAKSNSRALCGPVRILSRASSKEPAPGFRKVLAPKHSRRDEIILAYTSMLAYDRSCYAWIYPRLLRLDGFVNEGIRILKAVVTPTRGRSVRPDRLSPAEVSPCGCSSSANGSWARACWC